MSAKYVAAAVSLALLTAAASVCAEDFVPRAHASGLATTDSSPSDCPRGEVALKPTIDATATAEKTVDATAPAKTAASHPQRVGVDSDREDASGGAAASVASDAMPIGEGAPGKAGSGHKATNVLRWQSLLPGVMK
ncbi:MAG TPA: hypothetical protein VF132_06395 [Rudaea sp.]